MTESTHPGPELVGAPPPPDPPAEERPAAAGPEEPSGALVQPSFLFFGLVAGASLLVDVMTKAWAQLELSKRLLSDPSIVLIEDHLFFTLAYNKGGAWGLLQTADEGIRKPFFLAVSVLAIAFIVSLYGKLSRHQQALKWGLPLVLGGALGNLSDRVVRSSVIDFIDYRADWILAMNKLIASAFPNWGVTDHWPTFNVADISICVGVGLMAVDMFTSRRGAAAEPVGAPVPGADFNEKPGVIASPAGSDAVATGEGAPVVGGNGVARDPSASQNPAVTEASAGNGAERTDRGAPAA
jgi:signal peptidase II